jgi:D-sedoheptulose 7-phosphate isomerase
MSKNIKDIINDNIKVTNDLLNQIDNIDAICSVVLETIQNNKKILLCGNGGSATDSIHIASEIVGKFEKERKALPSISLSTNPSNLTSIGNDFGFENIFSRQVEALGDEGDMLIAISTSGNSQNIIRAVDTALNKKLNIIIFTGQCGGETERFDCLKLKVPSNNVARIQENHILVGHIIAKYLEENF